MRGEYINTLIIAPATSKFDLEIFVLGIYRTQM
jgi:hypothetical protein